MKPIVDSPVQLGATLERMHTLLSKKLVLACYERAEAWQVLVLKASQEIAKFEGATWSIISSWAYEIWTKAAGLWSLKPLEYRPLSEASAPEQLLWDCLSRFLAAMLMTDDEDEQELPEFEREWTEILSGRIEKAMVAEERTVPGQ